MGRIRLEIPSPGKPEALFAADPEPDWSFESLLSELNSLEKKINASSRPVYLSKSRPPRPRRGLGRGRVAFVMSVNDDVAVEDEEEDGDEEDRGGGLVAASRFCCDELYISDDSESELALDDAPCLLEEEGLEEVALVELRHDHLLGVEDEMRNQISALEMELLTENDKRASAFDRIVKYAVARKEADKKLDVQYQRKIAEALDNHITAIQRDHELKSQIEEKRIQNDAAEARRREKALQEERLRQEKARAEAEEKARAEEAAKLAALAAAKEAAEKKANDLSKQLTSASKEVAAVREGQSSSSDKNVQAQKAESSVGRKSEKAGDVVRAAKNALIVELERSQKLKKLEEENSSLIMNSNVDFSAHQRNIGRFIRTMSGVQQNVSEKANEILKILMNPSCPQSIGILAFVEKVVANAQSPSSSPFASAHVIILIASKIPQVLDFVLAEFHRACIYTVPKHLVYSEAVFKPKEAYYKALGYRQQHDGDFESDKSYLDRLKSYMMLYGALVQMETIQGFQNPHGPKEGWAWLARFLNRLPANRYTVVALQAFLTTAGFVLFRKYKSQFVKLLDVIKDDFLQALKVRKDPALSQIVTDIQAYIDDGQFRKEPEGRHLQAELLSNVMRPESEPSPNYYGYNKQYY